MPKIITSRRLESEYEKAREYIHAYILFPSSLLGLIFMVAGMAALVYQFMVISYSGQVFAETFGLLLAGAMLGWGQTRYQQYVLHEHPGYFASRMRLFSKVGQKRIRKDSPMPPLEHRGRAFVPILYLLGAGSLLGASMWISMYGQT
ncbi:MAG: hypothetical protein C4294_19315, partial [Nitrospiraceae bacterium]